MDWLPKMSEYLKEAGSYLKDGKLKMKETVTVGIEQAPRAFIDLLNGGNVGKMLVKLG
jgi:NADPH-dependent curcumin reductase CurA